MGSLSLSKRQGKLQSDLSRAIRAALPWVEKFDDAVNRAQSRYRLVAEALVALRHEFPSPDGQGHDLRGRSGAYRNVVRNAYIQAGADPNHPVSKRLTAGAAYWVRKLLLEKYGERKLTEMGVIDSSRQGPSRQGFVRATADGPGGLRDLEEAVASLNMLATDPEIVPTEDLVRAAIRAVDLLQQKLSADKKSRRFSQIAVV